MHLLTTAIYIHLRRWGGGGGGGHLGNHASLSVLTWSQISMPLSVWATCIFEIYSIIVGCSLYTVDYFSQYILEIGFVCVCVCVCMHAPRKLRVGDQDCFLEAFHVSRGFCWGSHEFRQHHISVKAISSSFIHAHFHTNICAYIHSGHKILQKISFYFSLSWNGEREREREREREITSTLHACLCIPGTLCITA